MARLPFLALSLILCSLNQATSEVYHIAAGSADLCDVPCVTLSQLFITNTNNFLQSNINLKMVFHPGTHYLTANFSVSNLHNLTMNSKSTVARIVCVGHSHMTFSRLQNVHIANLEFIGCAGNYIRDVGRLELQDVKFKDGGTALKLVKTTANILNSTIVSTNSTDRGTLTFERSKVRIEGSRFHNNTASGIGSMGGVLESYNSTITLKKSEFDQNFARFGGAIHSSSSNVTVEACYFANNNATYGGGLLFIHSHVIVKATDFISNNVTKNGGVLYSHHSNITIVASKLENNTAFNGGVIFSNGGSVQFKQNTLWNNSAKYGGVIKSNHSNVIIEACKVGHNIASQQGGVISSRLDTIKIEASKLDSNAAEQDGGTVSALGSNISIVASQFSNNTANLGGVVYISSNSQGYLSITASKFIENSASWSGGVLYCTRCTNISIERSEFDKNAAGYRGGVLLIIDSTIRMGDCDFTNNNSSSIGSVIYATHSSIVNEHGLLLIANNTAKADATVYLIVTNFTLVNDTLIFSYNLGSFMAFISNVMFMSTSFIEFASNQQPSSIQEGGAITLFQSNAFFYGTCQFECNHAENGGAILSIDSKIYAKGESNVFIAHNTALENGGCLHLSNSELDLQKDSKFVLFNNTAVGKGGGLHAVHTSIQSISASYNGKYTGTKLNLTGNVAKLGGGISMETNTKLSILKYNRMYYESPYNDANTIIFTANRADYGGALYVDDGTYSGICASKSKRNCFFQVFSNVSDDINFGIGWDPKFQSMYFSHNHANKLLGSTLYGGLLDRCAVSQFADVPSGTYKPELGISYFKLISDTMDVSISSLPTGVCLCSNELIDCTNQHHIEVKKGETFTVSVAAVDQIGRVINGTIQTSLNFTESGLAEGQLTREIPAECTDLTFSVVSPHNSEQLILYALDGPCKDTESSTRKIQIHFLPCSCPIGFQISKMNNTNCTCESHNDIKQYAGHCDSYTGSFTKTSQSRAWISYINDTGSLTGFLVYSNCPYDYCNSLPLSINLNEPDGADAHCAFNHSSLLCGSCQSGLSLSLGSFIFSHLIVKATDFISNIGTKNGGLLYSHHSNITIAGKS